MTEQSTEMQLSFFGPPMIVAGGARIALAGIPGVIMALLSSVDGPGLTNAELVERVWGDRRPATADTSLRVHLTRARAALAQATAGELLVRNDGLLSLAPHGVAVDIRRFRAAARVVQLVPEVEDARRTLQLWTGEPFQGLPFNAVLDRERRGLHMIRTALACVFAELLEPTPNGVFLGEIDALMREHPGNDRLTLVMIDHLVAAGCRSEAMSLRRDLEVTADAG